MRESPQERMKKITNDESLLLGIASVVTHITGVTMDELKRKGKPAKVSEARQILWTMAYNTGKFSQKYLANYFNRVDHTSVDFARRSVSNLYDSDKYFRSKIENIKVLMKDSNQITHNWETLKISQNEI